MTSSTVSDLTSYLLIPMETKNRELHAKLLLSCVAVKRGGFKVILGEKNQLHKHLRVLPRGIYVDKSIDWQLIDFFKENRRIGNRVVAWDEEGLAWRGDGKISYQRLAQPAFDQVDRFFAWGAWNAAAVKKKLEDPENKIVATGNPRFDLLLERYRAIFDEDVHKIRNRYGRFVLINTNFSRYNHFVGREYFIENLKRFGRIKTKEEEGHFWRLSDHFGELFFGFKKAAIALAKEFPDWLIIIRPHPSENHSAWHSLSGDQANIRVVHEGNVIPWILASKVVIHNSCTTGAESFVLGHPAVAYVPVKSDEFDAPLPNKLSVQVHDVESLVEAIKKVDNGEHITRSAEKVALENKHIDGLNGRTACEAIVDELQKIKCENVPIVDEISMPALEKYTFYIREHWRRIRFQVEKLRARGNVLERYKKQKFPSLSKKELEKQSVKLSRLNTELEGVRIRSVIGIKNCFSISDR